MLRKGANKIIPKKNLLSGHQLLILGLVDVGQNPSFLWKFGIYEQTNITVFAMTVAGSSAIPWRPPEAALYLGVIELCTSHLLF